MSTEVLYRKWRPRTFAEVAGQEAATRTLLNAVASGRVAHAYLFAGPRGTGKTTMGRLLAKAVNCLKPKKGEPCNRCESCKAFLENRALDLVELDAASNRGIDEIRSLREKANFAPASATYKVYLVDEVHMLTEPAFNALLKTLEEPPPHVIFILATTEVHKVPATIVSRCQRFDFRRIPLAAIVDRLEFVCGKESIVCPRDGLELVARTATGSLRDAINMLEQLVDYHGRELTIEQVRSGLGMLGDPRSGELAAHALRGELGDGLGLIASVRDDGVELRQFQRDVVAYLRGLLLVKAGAGGDSWTEEQLQEMRELVEPLPAERVVAALRAFGQADLRADPLSTLPLELALAECVLGPRESRPEAAELRPVAEAAPRGGRRGRERPAAAAHGDEKPVSPEAMPRPAARPNRIAAWAEETSEEAPAASAAEPAKPSEEAAPEPTAAATGEDAALEEARARWHDIYTQARALNHRTGALLNSGCDIIEVSEQEIVFGFRFEMLVDKMNSGDGGNNLRSLQEAVDQVLGPGHQVRCVVAQGLRPARPARGRGGHLVEAAREMGARVISDEG